MAKLGLKNISWTYPAENEDRTGPASPLNIEVGDGEFLALTGPRHSGISSLIRLIAGLDSVQEGEIWVGDRRVDDTPASDRGLALVARNHKLYPRMSVYRNIAFGLKQRRFSKVEEKKRVRAAAEIMGLEGILETFHERLTDEQRQRVALARAIALQPKILLLDEPLANLDRDVRRNLRGEIEKLHERLQVTMIYASHDPVEAMAFGGRIVVLDRGVVQQDGTAMGLSDTPANAFVARFVGDPPMNLVSGTLKRGRDGLIFSEAEDGTIEFRLPVDGSPAEFKIPSSPVLLGIRPEEIAVAVPGPSAQGANGFAALIDRVEINGSETDIYVQTGGNGLICRTRTDRETLQAGHRVKLELKLKKVRLFDPVSGSRID